MLRKASRAKQKKPDDSYYQAFLLVFYK